MMLKMIRIVLLLFCCSFLCALKAEEKASATSSLGGTVYVLTIDEEVLEGVLEKMDQGYLILKMKDRRLRLAPQVVMGVFGSRTAAQNARETIRLLFAQEGTGSAVPPPQESGDFLELVETYDMPEPQKKKMVEFTRKAEDACREILLAARDAKRPRVEYDNQIQKIADQMKVVVEKPAMLLEKQTQIQLYTLALLPMLHDKQREFLNSLVKLKKEVNKSGPATKEKKRMLQVLDHARNLRRNPAGRRPLW